MGNNYYAEILDILKENKSVALETSIKGEEGLIAEGLKRSFAPVEPVVDHHGIAFAKVKCTKEEDGFTVSEPFMPEERLIILGGGHVALQVSEFAARCGFRVTVCDDRPSFANKPRFPWAEEVICDTVENSIDRLKITPYDYVVIVTRGHKHDGDCLRKILPGKEPAYTGMIGSRRRVRELFRLLEEEGYSRERMDRICTPIGLNIGANTPAEIAISIMAELISYKRMPEHAAGRPCNDSDLQMDIIEYLAKDQSPKAIVTVIETKGSTPRGAGAKMAVGPVGEITGTIGGGCSEAAIMRDAIRIIGTGRYKVCSIDMTGDLAEDEGMVCGGTMKVLIEDGSSTEDTK